MKPFYVWTLLLTLGGIFILLLLLPTPEEVAMMELKSHDFESAEKYFNEQYRKGDRGSDIIIPLQHIETLQGNLASAINLMEEYTQAHPEDMNSWKLLGSLYRTDQQYDKYYQTLLVREKAPQNSEALHELVTWYTEKGMGQELCQTLQKLSKTSQMEPINYSALALCDYRRGAFQAALLLMEMKRERFPKSIEINDLFLELQILAHFSHPDGKNLPQELQVVDLIARFLNATKKPSLAFYSLSIIHSQYPKLAPAFIARLSPLIEKSPALEAMSLEVLWDQPNGEKLAYKKALALDPSKWKNPYIANTLAQFFLYMEDDKHLYELLQVIDVKRLEIRHIFQISEASLSRGRVEFVQILQDRFGEEYLQSHPLIVLFLQFGQGKVVGDKVRHYIDSTFVTLEERAMLLRLAAEADDKDLVIEIGKTLPPYTGFDDIDLSDIALAYVHIKRPKELYDMLEPLQEQLGKKVTMIPMNILNVALGRSKEVAAFVWSQKEMKEWQLDDLFMAAEEVKDYPFALFIAKRLLHDYPADGPKSDYALALVQVGKIHAGIELLRQLPKEHRFEKAYLTALVIAAKQDSLYREELREFINTHLQEKEFLRDFAYARLEALQDYKGAEDLFWQLAESAPAKSLQVQTLVYLWGPKATLSQVSWLETRAELSNQEDVSDWLSYLVYVGDYRTVVSLFCRKCPKADFKAYISYMDALIALRRQTSLHPAVCAALKLAKTKEEFEELVYYASESQDSLLKRAVLEHLVRIRPVCQDIAKASFEMHDYRAAANWLTSFFAHPCKAKNVWESLYESGMLLDREYKRSKAICAWRKALALMRRAKEKKPQITELAAVIYNEMGQDMRASREMRRYYEMTGKSPDAAAAWAQMLMDEGHLRWARKHLYKRGHSDPGPNVLFS